MTPTAASADASTASRTGITAVLSRHFELPGSANRMRPMEGLRGFSALLVFFVHFRAAFQQCVAQTSWSYAATEIAGSFGHAGVDIFFALSGFLMYGIVIRNFPGYRRFMARRIARVYPVFLAVFAVYLSLSLAFPVHSKIPPGVFQAGTYLLANILMLPGIIDIDPMIAVAWSLSYELFFYATIPLVVGMTRMRGWKPLMRIVLFSVVSIAFLLLWNLGYNIPLRHHPRLALFAAGALAYEFVQNTRLPTILPRIGEAIVTGLLVSTLAILGVAHMFRIHSAVYTVSAAGMWLLFGTALWLTVYALAFDGLLKRVFSWRYLRWFGNMSYSYYLTHGLALHGIAMVFAALGMPHNLPIWLFAGLLLLCFTGTVAFGAGVFLAIERPVSLRAGRPHPSTKALAYENDAEPKAANA